MCADPTDGWEWEPNPRLVRDTGNTRLEQLAMYELSQLCRVKVPELLGESDELLIFCFHHLNPV